MTRGERLGRNEDMFREVNERIVSLNDRLDADPEELRFVCECASAGCAEQLVLTRAEYEEVRRDGRQFVVTPGHELPEIEVVVRRADTYAIVRKVEGDAAEVAEALDPRDGG